MAEWLGPVVVIGYGLLILVLAWSARWKLADGGRWTWPALAVPVFLSFDNLISASALSLAEVGALPAAAIFGAMSGGLAWLGASLGMVLARRVPVPVPWLSGSLLALVGVVLCCREALL